jgi:hypothetical protein
METLFAGLFRKNNDRWFMERETVSLAFETGLSQVGMGSVHAIHPQGFANDPFYCDTHTDQLDAGAYTNQNNTHTHTHTHNRPRGTTRSPSP